MKPDPEFFAKTHTILDADRPVTISEVMFWDDNLANVTAARQFGFAAQLFEDREGFWREMGGRFQKHT